jgi:enoyl-CoA hydratase
MELETLLINREGAVGWITLNRPEKRNAITIAMMNELLDTLQKMDADPDIRCIILTGHEKAFAAGAEIQQMAESSAIDMLVRDQFSTWDHIRQIKTPIVAVVNGYALGGGCELAMTCDMIIASEDAIFGQPEVNIGVIPGAGGTQRLTRAMGKVKAMELILTGRSFTAQEALAGGLINAIYPSVSLMEEARKLALTISQKPPLAVRLAKEAIMRSFETSLDSGLDFERKAFMLLFASSDKQEGMAAFLEKRSPQFSGD